MLEPPQQALPSGAARSQHWPVRSHLATRSRGREAGLALADMRYSFKITNEYHDLSRGSGALFGQL
jgi:hypothetical protein